MSIPSITVREYHPDSGALLGNISVLNFGKITAGTHSRVKVIDIAFSGVTAIGNIKLGLIANGGITVNENPINIDSNGTASNGHFGIETTSEFDSSKASSSLTRHFQGVNSNVTAGDSTNATIPNRTEVISEYIYLDIEPSSTIVDKVNGGYKIFFDFS
jgi:hypothetical protein